MLLSPNKMKRPWVNDLLVVLAGVGCFAAFDIIGHRNTPYFWAKLICVLGFSSVCLLTTKDRGALDTFSAAISAFFALCAVAMTAGDRTDPNWWPFFLGFGGLTVLFILLTRKRRAALLAVLAVIGFRLLVFAVLRLFHRG